MSYRPGYRSLVPFRDVLQEHAIGAHHLRPPGPRPLHRPIDRFIDHKQMIAKNVILVLVALFRAAFACRRQPPSPYRKPQSASAALSLMSATNRQAALPNLPISIDFYWLLSGKSGDRQRRWAASRKKDRGRDLKEGSFPDRPLEGKRMEPLHSSWRCAAMGAPCFRLDLLIG